MLEVSVRHRINLFLVVSVSLLAAPLLAEAPPAKPAPAAALPPPDGGTKKAEFEKLLQERNEATRRLEDRASVPTLIKIATATCGIGAVFCSGYTSAARALNDDGQVLLGSIGATIGWSGVLVGYVTNLFLDKRKEDTEAVVQAQKKMDDAFMNF